MFDVIPAAPVQQQPSAKPEVSFELNLRALDEAPTDRSSANDAVLKSSTDVAPDASFAELPAGAVAAVESQPVDGLDVIEPADETFVTVPLPLLDDVAKSSPIAAVLERIGDLDLELRTEVAVSAGPEPEVAPVRAEETETDQFKVVGPLRIGIPLFNIFLNEADERSRRLTTEVAEWTMEMHRPVGETAVSLAHSLAGSSATVGYTELSHLARAFEHALMRSQPVVPGTAEEALLFVETAEEIRRLLHQFAAGFLKSPPQDLLLRLANHEMTSLQRLNSLSGAEQPVEVAANEPAPAAEAATETANKQRGDMPLPLDAQTSAEGTVACSPAATVDSPSAATEPVAPLAGVAPLARMSPSPSFGALGQAELKALTQLPVEALRSEAVRSDSIDDDDDIDAIDAVDAELFPIFEEEGQELLAELGSRLRDWSRRPSEMALASACMRTLHTLKGGARLAGAMRLGEMAHRLETAIEHLLAAGDAKSSDLDALQARADALTASFEVLQARDAQAYDEAGAAHVIPDHVEPFAESVPGALEVLAPESEFVLPAPDVVVPHKSELDLQRIDLPIVSAALPPQAPVEAPQDSEAGTTANADEIDWSRFMRAPSARLPAATDRAASAASQAAVRVRAALLERLVNQAGEVSITRSRIESEVGQIKNSLGDLTDNLERLRGQLRDIELQAETQMASRMEAAKAAAETFDPLEFDRFTRFQELTRMMAESVNDVATVQRTLQRTLEATEDELAAQTRLTRDLQDDLLRTRMVEFEGLSDRLYRVARQAAKETGKHVRLDIVGGSIEVDRGVLDRMTGAFEHLLRNSVTHGIESPELRAAAGKDSTGTIIVALSHEGNEVGVEFRDDGQGLNLERIREKGAAMGLLDPAKTHTDAEIANLIFTPGFSTAEVVTELAGRGIGMDVVRSEVNAMGGRIETATSRGHGTSFKLVLPLTTAVTQVVMLRCGEATVAVPSTLVEIVRRASPAEMTQAYATGSFTLSDRHLPFFWLGALLQMTPRGLESGRRTYPVVVIRSAQQRIVVHVDDVLGNQEVVVKNLGPQLSRMPGLAGMTLLASGVPALIYNPVALATLYGEAARAATMAALAAPAKVEPAKVETPTTAVPLILVVDDSLTVRRITQRLLVREGYRVMLAKDGLEALERLAEETPAVVLSDIEMPRMDGFDLVRNLRGDARWRKLPVIMITSRIAQKHRDHAGELGVDHYLGKPYAEEDLLALIGRYVGAEVTS